MSLAPIIGEDPSASSPARRPPGAESCRARRAAIATLAWGFFVLAPTANRLADNDVAWTTTPDGKPTPEAQVPIGSVVRVALLELLGFAAVFTAMILMRFGL